MPTEFVQLPLEVAQRVFDGLVGSMDFGSGFLDTEDVIALRTLAEVIGVDPITATPTMFRPDFPHPFVQDPGTYLETINGYKRDRCVEGKYSRRCGRPQDDPIHAVIGPESHPVEGTGRPPDHA